METIEETAVTDGPGQVDHSFRAEWRGLPTIHKITVAITSLFIIGLCCEGTFLVPYVVLRWGWTRG
jgi:hypothetical protein